MSVPKLRFPEFRDAGEWEIKPLKSICSMQAGKFISASNIFEKGKGGIYPCYGGNGLRGYTKTYTHSGRYSLIGRQGALCGNVNLANGDFYATEHAVVVTPKQDINVNWLFYKLDLLNLNKYATGQAQPGLSVEVLEKVQCIVPTKESEQQKIADCLSSIDDRITAETKKLDTLKAHKKGLMQQLFPAEGEPLPKLRFPEFRDSGNWEEEDLSKLTFCGLSNGVFNDPKKVGRGYKLINVLDMYIDTAINEDNLSLVELSRDEFSKNKVENGDLFFTRSSLVKSGIAYSNIYLGNSDNITFDGHLIRFRPNKKILMPIFVNYLLRTNKVRSQLVALGKTATMTTIGQADVGSVKLSFPHISEQQKIADCLTSIDEAIAAQSQAIDLLKLHKKGLMQQLFPSVEEVRG
jgi:type I restriction enzyme S subunit